MTSRTATLTRRRQAIEIYPYRRVWRTANLEALLLFTATVAVLLATRFAPFPPNADLRRLFAVGFALLPLALWLLITYRAERRAPQPRQRLFTVLILGALVASGVALPLTGQFLQVDDWLPTADGLTRLIGYFLAVGIVQEFLKYAVMRYSIWPGAFQTRQDGVAYAIATSIGYATALNLHFAFSGDYAPGATALRITEITLAHVAISPIMGYCLAELRQPMVSVLLVPGGLLLSAALAGFAIVFRGGLVVGGVAPGSTGSSIVFGLGMAVILMALLFSSMGFIINSADVRDRLRAAPE